MKKLLVMCLVLVLVLSFGTGCKKQKETYSLKLSTVLADNDPITIGLEEMAKEVEEKTNGRITVEVYPSSQLGDTADVLEQAKSGSNVGVVIDTGMLADYVPDMAIYTAPYVFDSVEEAREFIETDIFKAWDKELATHGLRDLSCNWYQGARHFLSNKPIRTPADLKGVRVRTMGSKVAQESMKAMGATPTSLAWSEVYSGLQQKVIDSAEAQLPAVYGASLHEVIDYVAETGHFLLYTALVISEEWFQSLSKKDQEILIEASKKAGDYATELTLEKEVEFKEEMEKAGVTFMQVDITPFKKASASVYETMGWTELKGEIDAALGK
jgi:tripartite ATP-independent transporter DctP family solute receptor